MVKALFDVTSFMPHGACYLWAPGILRLHIISDSLIALAYFSIPLTLFYLLTQRTKGPFGRMILLFGAFIFACGLTHAMEVLTVFVPLYWLSGLIKAVTAILSVAAAVAVIPFIPKALTLRAPQELEEINRQLQIVSDEHQRVAAKLLIANKELETFSYSVSHDLRAPLRGIDGFSRILLETQSKVLDAEGVAYLHRVIASVKRMGSLIDDLLALSHLSQASMRTEPVDLSALAETIFQELKQNDPERQVRYLIAPKLVVQGDPHLLHAFMANLIGNAWKFTTHQPQARIELGVGHSLSGPAYFVRDNGAGFDMRHSSQLFGAFQRLHSVEEFPGNGIGLATAQRIMHRHGGRIWAEGKVDNGATFYFAMNSWKKGVAA